MIIRAYNTNFQASLKYASQQYNQASKNHVWVNYAFIEYKDNESEQELPSKLIYLNYFLKTG